jgi:hypothetical protein
LRRGTSSWLFEVVKLRVSGWLTKYSGSELWHHGSSYQDPELLDAVDPRVALVSVGTDNSYGHPNPPVLYRLADNGARVLRTDLDGDVAVVSTSDGLSVVGMESRPGTTPTTPDSAAAPTGAPAAERALWLRVATGHRSVREMSGLSSAPGRCVMTRIGAHDGVLARRSPRWRRPQGRRRRHEFPRPTLPEHPTAGYQPDAATMFVANTQCEVGKCG